jgi:hypothetical protein
MMKIQLNSVNMKLMVRLQLPLVRSHTDDSPITMSLALDASRNSRLTTQWRGQWLDAPRCAALHARPAASVDMIKWCRTADAAHDVRTGDGEDEQDHESAGDAEDHDGV